MIIDRIYIKEFEQFKDVTLDFRSSGGRWPSQKICLIGSNGTGKSKLLRLIRWFVEVIIRDVNAPLTHANLSNSPNGRVLFEIFHQVDTYFVYFINRKLLFLKSNEQVISNDELVNKLLSEENDSFFAGKFWNQFVDENALASLPFKDNNKDILIYSPAESDNNGYKNIIDVPVTNVSEALELSKSFPFYAEVSSEKVNNFWKLLVFNLRKRAEERDAYENLPENLIKTKAKLIEEFDKIHPKILEHLGYVWNKILRKANLEFDIEGASNPYQLNDNLKVYIKLINENKIIPYAELSTGIRNYIFRLGHIFSLFFNREIHRGILLVDEPENSLYPDFLFELVETYDEVIKDKLGKISTQMFFATHNPIIAAQFKPDERIILEWKEDGTVKANKGITPEGDDPNDILKKDFGLHQLMGAVGIQQWNNYLELKKKLKEAKSTDEKMNIAAEINKIGQLYNFPA